MSEAVPQGHAIEPNVTTLSTCPSCGGSSLTDRGKIPASPFFAGKRLDQPLPGGHLVACNNCALQFKNPQLTKEYLNALYEAGEEEHWQHESGSRVDWEISYRWISGIGGVNTILDIGCFDGQFLSKLFADKARYGIEIHPGASRKASERGIEMLGSDFDVLKGMTSRFDVVTAFDVIEHVHDPRNFLRSLLAVLRPGGHLILSTGNTQALSWRLMGSGYWYCTIPEHISFINPTWVQGMCKEFRVELVESLTFSHGRPSSRVSRAKEAAKNLLYRLSPKTAALARRAGLGGTRVESDSALALLPPPWLSAQDHFIVLIQKTVSSDR